ncbi:MAG: glycerol-3-phosphate acyltransferase, partial [Mesorhizobium sp.]
GGKGVATYLGVLIALAWQVALIFALVWLAMALLFRYSSLAALTAAIVVPIALYVFSTPEIAGLFALMSLIVFVKHRANITRLLAGAENKIGAKE